MTQPASQQPTKEQWTQAFQAALPLFIQSLGAYKLKEPAAVFNILVQFARQVGAITEPDPAKIAEAVRGQVKDHLFDRNSIGLQNQQLGRGIQMADLIIQWVPGCEPPALLRNLPKSKKSWHEEVEEREKEAEEHKQYLEARKKSEYWRSQCPGIITSFQPVRRGGIGIDHASIQSVTATLQKYLDGYEAEHQEDLQAFEADPTFRGWRVHWEGVAARMQEFVEKEYNRVEGRTLESERI